MKIDVFEKLAARFNYNKETGVFTWKEAGYEENRAGKIAGSNDANGYIVIKSGGVRCYGHRLAWYMATGTIPTSFIDHINGIPSDNRISNLRLCTQRQNMFNRKIRSDNTSGQTGVCWHKNKWRSFMKINGKTVSLGFFDKKEDAINCYKAAAENYQGDFYRS